MDATQTKTAKMYSLNSELIRELFQFFIKETIPEDATYVVCKEDGYFLMTDDERRTMMKETGLIMPHFAMTSVYEIEYYD